MIGMPYKYDYDKAFFGRSQTALVRRYQRIAKPTITSVGLDAKRNVFADSTDPATKVAVVLSTGPTWITCKQYGYSRGYLFDGSSWFAVVTPHLKPAATPEAERVFLMTGMVLPKPRENLVLVPVENIESLDTDAETLTRQMQEALNG